MLSHVFGIEQSIKECNWSLDPWYTGQRFKINNDKNKYSDFKLEVELIFKSCETQDNLK